MGKSKTRKTKAKPQASDELVNEFAARHGNYERNLRVVINRGGTALDRWRRDGLLSDSQEAAILHCQRLWRMVEAGPRLVANLDRTVFGSPGEGNVREIEARNELAELALIFAYPLDKYWNIFEMVCRFDEPAGVAGSSLTNDTRAQASKAHLCVCFVADTIATKVRMTY